MGHHIRFIFRFILKKCDRDHDFNRDRDMGHPTYIKHWEIVEKQIASLRWISFPITAHNETVIFSFRSFSFSSLLSYRDQNLDEITKIIHKETLADK